MKYINTYKLFENNEDISELRDIFSDLQDLGYLIKINKNSNIYNESFYEIKIQMSLSDDRILKKLKYNIEIENTIKRAITFLKSIGFDDYYYITLTDFINDYDNLEIFDLKEYLSLNTIYEIKICLY